MLSFKEWFMAVTYRTGGKLGLYAPIDDALGQYPPLYATARIADVITYIDIAYKGGEPTGKNGIIRYHDGDPRVRNTHVHKRRK
jgi:hypothetical protein